VQAAINQRDHATSAKGNALTVLLAVIALFGAGALLLPLLGLKAAVLPLLALLGFGRARFATANGETAAGTHKALSLRADAALSYTHLLLKAGSDDFHVAVCGAANRPLGTTTDASDAAEDLINVHPLELAHETRKVRVATAIAKEVDLYTAANGFAQALPGTAGTYYRIGRTVALAVQEGSGNYLAEFAPCPPVKVLVIATATGTAATDIAALFTALQSGPAEVKSL
jgi:hypothetical protein